ncbi:MAG: hypothetical protein HC838_00995 [Spirulinaceae cyanobacterium RM2_2_10]|nr:hypothetical protein [Spirulinaceae cyanobacterium SM2_1_0]NJO18915.1 hypothetical protein [Spirulinaceae cyanobacterium RM2_2_10]
MPEQTERYQEISMALRANCDNPAIDEIVLLNEQIYELPFEHKKIRQVNLGHRLTLQAAYDYANRHDHSACAWCLANCDIAFDKTLNKVDFDQANVVHCLTRYERTGGGWELFGGSNAPRPDSQDSWIFLTPQIPLVADPFTGLTASQIEVGRLGFDNKIALILHTSGFLCKNSSKTIKTYHYHFRRDEQQDLARMSQRLPSPYLFVEPAEIHEDPRLILCAEVMVNVEVKPEHRLETLQLQWQATFNEA